jgi:hypothetical protein
MKKILPLISLALLLGCSTNKPDGKSQYQPFAPDGIPFVVADSAFLPDGKGNHRAVVRVVNPDQNAVVVTIPWRRPDLRPETKKIVVYAMESGKEIQNVHVLGLSAETGEIAFQPQAGEQGYYVYYLPYKFRRGWDDARYGKPWNDYLLPEYTADPDWTAEVGKNLVSLPRAKVERIESRSEFDVFTPMGLIATSKEIQAITDQYSDDFLIYTEDRAFPIRLPYGIPAFWAKRKPDLSFNGHASRNEYYCWQIGLWAVASDVRNVKVTFTDFVAGTDTISKDSLTCFNQGGTNWDGNPVVFAVDVPKGNVQALWCGIPIPPDAKTGKYSGIATITADGSTPKDIRVNIRVDDQLIADRGDGEEWRHSRLRWLNSTIGIDDLPVTPYDPMVLSENRITATGKDVKINSNGLPESIEINHRQVLNNPVSFEVETGAGTVVYKADNLSVRQLSTGKVVWTASSEQDGLSFDCAAEMEFDGFINYTIKLSALNGKPVTDIQLRSVYTPVSSTYFMGTGFSGGARPESHTWDWQGPNDSYWIGGDQSGLHVEFIGDVYHGPLIADYKPGPPANWSNGGAGRIDLKGMQGRVATLIVSTGPVVVTSEPLVYRFNLLITPLRTVDPSKHFVQRYYHADPKGFSKAAEEGGANIGNIHHAQSLNPYINYPFIVRDSLIRHIEEQHQAGRKVKLYYTVRELTTHCPEVYALKSLKHQIFTAGVGYGLPWECEHLIDDYKPAWYTELPDQNSDAALVLEGSSRWINYYLEGLRWMLENYKIDGLYMDDVSFDRPVMKRMRKIMEKYRPGALIDLHSNTGYSRGPANQYTGFFPYVDRLWFGESFQYNKMTPDEWFVTFSGIPFGLMSEMLQGGGNRYLGMVYGATGRDAYGVFSPRPVWNLWKTFGIAEAKMIGYWDQNCPVKTSHPDVKATCYLKSGKVLVSIGNFDDADQMIRLSYDWKALGLDPARVEIQVPEVQDFQSAGTFKLNDPLPVKSKQGWLLILQEK